MSAAQHRRHRPGPTGAPVVRPILAVIPLALAVACGGQATVAGNASPATSPPAAASVSGPPPTGPTAAGPAPTAESNPAGDIPDNQVFVPFTLPGRTLQVSVPEGWAQTSDGAATVFTDKFNSVRVEVVPGGASTEAAAVRATEVPPLQGSVPGFALQSVRTVQRRSGTAALIAYSASSPIDPVTGKSVPLAVERYLFPHGDQQAVVTLSGPPGADNVDPWRIVTDSLRWLP